MKNILVVGPPRTGKSTLSKLIVKQIPSYSVINLDVIRECIYKSICTDMEKEKRNKLVKDIFPNFLKTMLKQYTNYYNPELFYVIEGDLLSLDDALELKKEYDVDIVYIGTPSLDEKTLFERTRKNASIHGCWTDVLSDEKLYKLCFEIIQESKDAYELAKSEDIIYLDNSFNNCLQDYVDSIKQKINIKKSDKSI